MLLKGNFKKKERRIKVRQGIMLIIATSIAGTELTAELCRQEELIETLKKEKDSLSDPSNNSELKR